jgi:hypothetical protein
MGRLGSDRESDDRLVSFSGAGAGRLRRLGLKCTRILDLYVSMIYMFNGVGIYDCNVWYTMIVSGP